MPEGISADGSLQSCPGCGALVDVREQEPLAKINCPLCGADMVVQSQFNHFVIVETLGSGGMGSVFKARDQNLDRLVALKLLRRELSADDNYILRLEDEARLTASINHPNVVKVFSFGSDRGQYYIAMELVDKGSLDELMGLQQRVAESQVLQVGLQVASGLQAAQEKGLIHRDVKPGNILFADAHTAKITDFGLALVAEHEAESRGEIWGTPYYIAPEKLNNEPEDFRSDIYSLGGTLFHAVAGRPPFEAESASLVALKHLKSRAVSLQAFAPDVSSETAYVINRMLHKDPNQRYASYAELIDHLKYAADTVAANASKPRGPKTRLIVDPEAGSNLAGLLTLALLATVVVLGILAFVFRDRLFGTGGRTAGTMPVMTTDSERRAGAGADVCAEARKQIVAQQLSAAQSTLTALSQKAGIGQPDLTWIHLHQGLVALLDHHLSDSRDIFEAIEKGGAFSAKPSDAKLATFFVEVSRALTGSTAVPASQTKAYDKNTYQGFGLLLIGLKDWEQGEFESANAFFLDFADARPDPSSRWIDDYQPLVRAYVHDYMLYAPLRSRLDAGGGAQGGRADLRNDLSKARGELLTTGKMPEAFYAAENQLKAPHRQGPPAARKTPGATSSPSASTVAESSPPPTPTPSGPTAAQTEAPIWKAAADQYARSSRAYNYDAALKAVQGAVLTDPGLAHTRDQAIWRAQRLIAFKRTLAADITATGGYPEAITTIRGVNFQQGLKNAGDQTLSAITPYGAIAIPWSDLAPRTVLAIADHYIDATADTRNSADRRWLAAVFALENGFGADAGLMATQAARDRPDYQKELPRFNE